MATTLTNVVLPAPLGPRIASTLPWGTVRSSPSTAVTFPNRTVTPQASMSGVSCVAAPCLSALSISMVIVPPSVEGIVNNRDQD